MENQASMSKAKYYYILLVLATAFTAANCTGYLFASYYQLCADAFQLTASQMGTLMSMTDTLNTFGYILAGVVADVLKPKLCLTVGWIGMVVCAIFMMMMPGYNALIVLNLLMGVFGVLFTGVAIIRFASTFAPKEMQGRSLGWLYSLSGVTMLILGTITSRNVLPAAAECM